ncbi:MAG TPA: trypsin-like serine protease, partial [Spirochaetes bacterium]|nr:trypsin-like serine protease [Spirochaetota bacterium]
MNSKWTPFSKILMIGLLGLLFLFTSVAGAGERIIVEMNNGDRLEGELIKKDENNLYMYFGGKIISISQDKVKSLKKIGIQKASTGGTKNFEFYKTANLPIKSIQTHVRELGQAVVLVKTPSGLGTGWFCNQKGYLVTNNHVVAKEKSITVTIFPRKGQGFGKKVYKKVRIIALNADLDLALLKIEETIHENYPQLFLGDSTKLKAGEKVFLIGNPLGLERSTSQGIISKVSRNYGGRLYLQTTAPISPGNSGGPLFNERGEVVGVINMGFKYLDGLGFAIPSKYIKEFLNNIEAFAYDNDNPNNGFQYMEAPITSTDRKIRFTDTEFIKSSFGISHLTLADLNGDGTKEIVFANNDKAEIEIIRLANEGDQKKLNTPTDLEDINRLKESDRFASDIITVSSKIFSLGVGDFTGDNRPDIVFYGDVDGLALLEQKADGTFKTAKKIDDIKISERRDALKVVDINGDGLKDIFTMGKKSFTIFLSGKEKKEYPLNTSYVNKINHYDIMDINKDGRKDIVFFVLDKHYAVYVRLQNEAGGFVEEIPVRSNISGPVVRYFGDSRPKFLTLDNGLNRVREIVLTQEKQ